MTFHPTEQQLEIWVMGNDRLPPSEQNRIQDHLPSCSLCREHVQRLQESFSYIQDKLGQSPTPGDLDFAARMSQSRARFLLPLPASMWKRDDSTVNGYLRLPESTHRQLLRGGIGLIRRYPVQAGAIVTGIVLGVMLISFLHSLPASLSVTSIEPKVFVGSSAFDTLMIRGSGFRENSKIVISIVDPPERSFLKQPVATNPEEITLALRVGTDPSVWSIQILNPDSVLSDTLQFRVIAPQPETPWLIPKRTTARGPGLTLSISGTTFTSYSIVRWNGRDRVTTPIVNRGGLVTGLNAAISASDIATPGKAEVTVYNPGPGGGLSSPAYFAIDR